jgi:predicted branched-subunit amino acid permease
VLPGVAAFGVIAGVAMVTSGITPALAMLMSLLVFAGASMVAAAQLLASGSPAALVILATVFINLRFMMYSASLRQYFGRETLGWRLAIAYLQADNVYGLTLMRYADRPAAPAARYYFLGAALVVWAAWQLAVGAGIGLGAGVPAAWRLEVAAPLAFVAMTIPLLRERAMVAAAVVAAITVIATAALPFKMSVPLAALAGIGVGLAFERSWR